MAETAPDYSLNNSDVITKYKTAATIANNALQKVMEACQPGALIIDICKLGDATVEALSKGVYTKGNLIKGIAFPTCISVNEIVCHFSPLPSDPEAARTISDGDVVKIELGCHIDGFAATSAHTLVVGATKENPVTGRKADAIKAAYLASEAALRMLKPGNKNSDVTDVVQKIAASFDVLPVEGMMSHQQERNIIDGKKQIVLNPSDQQRNYERCEFAEGEVWAVDVLVSTGDAKPRDSELRTTVHRKTATAYQLKIKAARMLFAEISSKFGLFPFGLREVEDEKRARMGILECTKHNVVTAYPVYTEKEGEVVAQFMFTALLTPSGLVRLTPSLYDEALVQSEKKLQDEELKKMLHAGIGSKKKNKKKKKAEEKAE